MSDFGDFSSSNDPTADFLARERAVLGGDADLFSTMDNISDFTSPISISETPDLAHSTTQSQYAALSPSSVVSTPANDYSVFESNYPQAEHLESSKVLGRKV